MDTTNPGQRPNQDRARELHSRAIIVDTHNDVIVRLLRLGHDLSKALDEGFIDLPSMAEGNFTAQFFAVQVPQKYYGLGTAAAQAEKMLDGIEDFVASHNGQMGLARSADDIRRLAAEGRFSAILCIEGAHFIGENIASLDALHERGIRYITPAHFYTSSWSDSATDVRRHGGLSELGRRAIREMNRLGIVVDAAHISDEAFWQVMGLSTRPVMVSHGGVRARLRHPRNITDEMIRTVGEKGGLFGVCPYPEFLTQSFYDTIEAKALELSGRPDIGESIPSAVLMDLAKDDPVASYRIIANLNIAQPALRDYVDHIEHAARLAGPDHICMGIDHGAIDFRIQGFETCAKLPALTEALLDRGFSDNEARGIMGENVLAFLDRHDHNA
jgi:membrane dipeptidase